MKKYLNMLSKNHNAIVSLATIIGLPAAILTMIMGFWTASEDRKQFQLQFEMVQKQYKVDIEEKYFKILYQVSCTEVVPSEALSEKCVPIAGSRERTDAARKYIKVIGTSKAPEDDRPTVRPFNHQLNLSNARLEETDLSELNLQYSAFDKANLKNSNLSYSKLTGARMYKANLDGANLYEAILTKATLNYISLENAHLRHASLDKATISDSYAQNSRFDEAYMPNIQAIDTDFTNSIFNDADLSNAELQHSNFTKTILVEANLSGSNMMETNLSGADLNLTNLTNVKGLTCSQLKQAKNWQKSIRNSSLSCK